MFELIRWSMFLATVSIVVIGYADQLRLIFVNKSTDGLSLVMILTAFWSWVSYMLYGFLKKDYKMFWPNLFGSFAVGLILLSFLLY